MAEDASFAIEMGGRADVSSGKAEDVRDAQLRKFRFALPDEGSSFKRTKHRIKKEFRGRPLSVRAIKGEVAGAVVGIP